MEQSKIISKEGSPLRTGTDFYRSSMNTTATQKFKLRKRMVQDLGYTIGTETNKNRSVYFAKY